MSGSLNRRAIARLAARAAIVLAALVPWLRLLDGTWGLYFFALALGGETLFVPLLALAAVSALTLLVILPAAAVWRVAARRQPSAVQYAVAGGLLLSAAFHLGAITVHAISYAIHPPAITELPKDPLLPRLVSLLGTAAITVAALWLLRSRETRIPDDPAPSVTPNNESATG